MDKSTKFKYYLDLIMSITILITAITGIINLIIVFILGDDIKQFLGVKPTNWITIHGIFGVTTVLLVVIHLIVHKDWIVFNSKKLFKDKE